MTGSNGRAPRALGRTPRVLPRWLGRLLAVLLVAAFVVLPALPASAEEPPGLEWSISIDGRNLETVTRTDPLQLGSSDSARVQLDLTNGGAEELKIRSVRIEGQVIGMTFFSYTTRLDIVVPAGQQTQRRFDIDISDLSRQATGLLPTSAVLIGPDRKTVAEKSFPVDVRGSAVSIYGAFGLAMAGITAVVLAGLLLAIRRRQLPTNRWQRGLRFLPSGLGIGVVLTFTLSALRLLVPNAWWWLPILLLFGGGAFLLGYFLPLGSGDEQPSEDDSDSPDGESDEEKAELSELFEQQQGN